MRRKDKGERCVFMEAPVHFEKLWRVNVKIYGLPLIGGFFFLTERRISCPPAPPPSSLTVCISILAALFLQTVKRARSLSARRV